MPIDPEAPENAPGYRIELLDAGHHVELEKKIAERLALGWRTFLSVHPPVYRTAPWIAAIMFSRHTNDDGRALQRPGERLLDFHRRRVRELELDGTTKGE